MQYLWDADGKRYLDLFGGVCTIAVGHCHPRLVEAGKKQLDKIHHTTQLYLNPTQYELMDEINKYLPKGEEWVFHFTNSGSEATDFAMLMARVYTQNSHVISMRNGYHGMTEGSRNLVGVPGWKHQTASSCSVVRAIAPLEYRGLLGTDSAEPYLQDLQYLVNIEVPKVAAFIAERIQGVGGLYPLLKGYLPKAYEIIRKHGGVTISDEVQCGFGRLGTHFWGFEVDGVVPDIITCAKSIGNGTPMGLTIAKKKITECMKDQAFFNTFGGNPVSCAIALENLRVIRDEKIQENAKTVGDVNLAGLKKLQEKYEVIGSVRGQGFIVGVELVANPATKQPMPLEKMLLVMESLRESGILVGRGGTFGNVIRLQGPMCATVADIEYFHFALGKALAAL